MSYPVKSPKKLIEVALPLDAINKAAAREKSIRHGHPSTLHLWWARRPLAAARAVIFSQLVNDPSWKWELEHPGEIPPNHLKASWAASRKRLFKIIEDLVQWENTTNEDVLESARSEIRKSWREVCELNREHPDAQTLFNPAKMPGLHDPFAGGGTIPLEAQRLGLEAYASDLNPVAVLINKAMIEIPPKFSGLPPVNPESRLGASLRNWQGAQGLAEDVRYYGKWMRDEAEKRIGHLYPKIEITQELAKDRSDLKGLVGQKLTVIAWLWARTVKSPNPAFSHVDVPLVSTFVLSSKEGKESYVEPVIEGDRYRFEVRVGRPPSSAEDGTKLARGANFRCLMSSTPIASDHIYGEANAGRMSERLMAIVAEGARGRVYLAPTEEHESVANKAKPQWKPDIAMPENPRWFSPPLYGLKTYGDLFTPRQLVALTTFSDLVGEALAKVQEDFLTSSGSSSSPSPFMERGLGGEVPITGHALVLPEKLRLARAMRKLPTGTEARAWEFLRDRRCHGLKFRRQQVIQGFIVDFYCPELRLAIELDGPIHDAQAEYDAARDQALEKVGVRVVRVKNEEVTRERLEGITSPPNPLSINGEGESEIGLEAGGLGARAYAEAVGVYLGFAVSKALDRNSSLCFWEHPMDRLRGTFGRQALPMVWDFAETNPLAGAGGDIAGTARSLAEVLDKIIPGHHGIVLQGDACSQSISADRVVSTDPPYYDNIGYADLSDFFYVWLRRCLRDTYPSLFVTMSVPKAEELVATPYRHGSKESAEGFFLIGMTRAMKRLADLAHPSTPVTIYYAFKQAETKEGAGTSSTGWETFLQAVGNSGLALTGTWPMRTELTVALKKQANALASSIVLVCRKRAADAPTISRRQFLRELYTTLPQAMDEMTRGSGDERSPVAPVDLSQAVIGPGMAVFSKYSAVLEADGTPMSVKTALQLINRFLAEDDFDRDTQFCLHWFEQHGWTDGVFGEADVLARAKATSVMGMAEAGVLQAGAGKVRLLRWAEYPADWDPQQDIRLPDWEVLHQLIRAQRSQGDTAAGRLLGAVKGKVDAVRQLAYRLFTLCERKGWAEDARAYNELITSWSGVELAANSVPESVPQLKLFGGKS